MKCMRHFALFGDLIGKVSRTLYVVQPEAHMVLLQNFHGVYPARVFLPNLHYLFGCEQGLGKVGS